MGLRLMGCSGYGWSACRDAQIPIGEEGEMMDISVKSPRKVMCRG
jgi:hypothetical protein